MSTTIERTAVEAYDFSAIVAENIRALAARRGYTQVRIADALGLNQSTVSLRWNGKRAWPLEDIARVAVILSTTPWDLATPSPEYERGQSDGLAPVRRLPRLDSNQQPFDYRPWADAVLAFAA